MTNRCTGVLGEPDEYESKSSRRAADPCKNPVTVVLWQGRSHWFDLYWQSHWRASQRAFCMFACVGKIRDSEKIRRRFGEAGGSSVTQRLAEGANDGNDGTPSFRHVVWRSLHAQPAGGLRPHTRQRPRSPPPQVRDRSHEAAALDELPRSRANNNTEYDAWQRVCQSTISLGVTPTATRCQSESGRSSPTGSDATMPSSRRHDNGLRGLRLGTPVRLRVR